MDKIKYIKLEQPDGSYSDSIPLAVDADHVDVNGKTLTNVLGNKANNIEVQNESASRQRMDASLQNQINVEKTRIDNITHLPKGSTSGDAELQDIRIGYDGQSYENAGNAVRRQISNIYTEFNTALKFIDIPNPNLYSNLIANIDNNQISFITNVYTDKPGTNTGILINSQYSLNYMLQIFIEFNLSNTIFTRIVNKNTHAIHRDWEIVGVAGKGINLNNDTIQTECNNDINNLKNNLIYGFSGALNAENLPIYGLGGQIITLGKQMSRTNSDIQIAVDSNNNMYHRVYWNNQWSNWTKNKSIKKLDNLKYSVLGDSRSTFRDISPWSEYCHYPDNYLKNASDMWWSIVEKETGMQRVKIDAFSGSRISTGGSVAHYADGYEFCTDIRINELIDGETVPDIVFIYGGVNDWYNNISIGNATYNSNDTDNVANALAITIKKIQTKISNAKIYVILENYTDNVYKGQYNFPVNSSKIPLGDLIQAQKDVCEKMRIPYIDTSVLNIGYNNVTSYLPDYVHGNIKFNKSLANIIIERLIRDTEVLSN